MPKRNIVCYRRGCNNSATWTIPGHPPVHVCSSCLRGLADVQEPVLIGPTESKEKQDVVTDSPAI